MPRTSWEKVGEFRAWVPSNVEQRAIADYLDTETGRIDGLVAKKRRMIDLFAERRQAVVQAAVAGDMTRAGLHTTESHMDQHATLSRRGKRRWSQASGRRDPEPMTRGKKVTGCPLKHLLDLNDSGIWGENPTGRDDVVVLRSTDIALDGSWRIFDPAVRQVSEADRLRKRLTPGDIVVVKSSGSPEHLGKSAIVTKEVAAMNPCFANFVQRLRPSSPTDSRYIWYVLNSKSAADTMASLGKTTTGLRNLNAEIIGSVLIPVRQLPEQRVIADYLDVETGRIDALISRTQGVIDLLAERRQALITAAVTGQLAIPGVAA